MDIREIDPAYLTPEGRERMNDLADALKDVGEVVPIEKLERHMPEGNCIIFEAPQRWGKTLAGVIWALDSFQNGRPIFSNIQLGFPHDRLEFEEVELENAVEGRRTKFWGGHIFIDELNFYFDGRRSMKQENLNFGAFLLQQKKQGCHLTGTTHDLMSLDVRLRTNYDFLIRPEVYPKYPNKPHMLKMVIENGPLQARFRRTLTLDCRPFLSLYDTHAVYNPFKTSVDKPRRSGKPASRVEL